MSHPGEIVISCIRLTILDITTTHDDTRVYLIVGRESVAFLA